MTASATAAPAPHSRLLEQMPREEFLTKVRRIKYYIAAGDIFQANFAQRWKVQTDARPIDIFRRAINEITRRHESLRMSVQVIDGTPFQNIAPTLSLDIPLIDLTRMPAAEREPAVTVIFVGEPRTACKPAAT